MRLRLGASGAEKLCALGAMIRRSARPLNFTVRRPSATTGDTHLRYDSSRHFDSAPEARRAGS
jgi:hypothetical protein